MGVDYIVVGAGSSGCVLAARLCEAGATVAIVEAGGRTDLVAVKARVSVIHSWIPRSTGAIEYVPNPL
jgi:choline dehydrogenase-like flavoprotein